MTSQKLPWVNGDSRRLPETCRAGDYLVNMDSQPWTFIEIAELDTGLVPRCVMYDGESEDPGNPWDVTSPVWSHHIPRDTPMHDLICAYLMALRMGVDVTYTMFTEEP